MLGHPDRNNIQPIGSGIQQTDSTMNSRMAHGSRQDEEDNSRLAENKSHNDNHDNNAGSRSRSRTSARHFQSLQQGALSHEQQLISASAITGTGAGRNGDYTQLYMAAMTEAYTHSDPTQAEDGLFLNPSDPLILNASEGDCDWDEDDLAALGFGTGENPFDGLDNLELALEGNAPSRLQQPEHAKAIQLGEYEGEDLGADLEALEANLEAYFEAEASETEGQSSKCGGQGLDASLEVNLEAYSGVVASGAEAQLDNFGSLDLEADLEAAFDEYDTTQATGEIQHPGEVSQQQTVTHTDEYESYDLNADLQAAFEEIDSAKAADEEDVDLDDDLEALFSTEDEENDDELFGPPDTPPTQSTNTALPVRDDAASTTKNAEPIPIAVQTPLSWLSQLLPSLPIPVQSSPPTEIISGPDHTCPSWTSSLPSRPGSIEHNATPPVLLQTCQPPPPMIPAITQINEFSVSPDQFQSAQNKRPLVIMDPFTQIVDEGSQLFLRSFVPDAPIEPARKKPKIMGLPNFAGQPAYFQMDKLTFVDFEKLAKAFMLDPTHPERYESGSGSVQYRRRDISPSICNLSASTKNFLEDGIGEKYFGARSSNYTGRDLKWPEEKDRIADLVLPLLRKICRNESQRLYAKEKRDERKAAEAEANAAGGARNQQKARRRRGRLSSTGDMSQISFSRATTEGQEEIASPARSFVSMEYSKYPAQSPDSVENSQCTTQSVESVDSSQCPTPADSPESVLRQAFAQASAIDYTEGHSFVENSPVNSSPSQSAQVGQIDLTRCRPFAQHSPAHSVPHQFAQVSRIDLTGDEPIAQHSPTNSLSNQFAQIPRIDLTGDESFIQHSPAQWLPRPFTQPLSQESISGQLATQDLFNSVPNQSFAQASPPNLMLAQMPNRSSPLTPVPLGSQGLQFSVNFVLEHKKYTTVRPKITLDDGRSRSYLSMVDFIEANTPEEYFFCSFCLHGPGGLVKIENEDNWRNVICQISQTDWMGREARCIAGLQKITSMIRKTSTQPIVID